MSTEENKATVRRWLSTMQTTDTQSDMQSLIATIDQTFASDFVDHDGPDLQNGREAMKMVLSATLHRFADFHLTVEQLIAEGDLVAVRLQGEATLPGGWLGVPPTGKSITWTQSEFLRFEQGRIVESWPAGNLNEVFTEAGVKDLVPTFL